MSGVDEGGPAAPGVGASRSAMTAPAPHPEVRPAPVLEFCYAYYHLLKPVRQRRPLPWHRQLLERPPGWLATAKEQGGASVGYEALLLACAFGYDADPGPERFLADLPALPARLVAEFDAVFDHTERRDDDDPNGGPRDRLRRAFEALDPVRAQAVAANLAELWAQLAPLWEESGRQLVATASRRFLDELGASDDVASYLPAHHFVNLEDSAADIRHHRGRGPTLVVPLYFAARGGFKFVLRGRLCLGYGVRSEDLYEEQKEDVADLANRLKAFSDPTRLLLMFQVARLARFPLTVGDLARQLNVSQPTASGHLRLLRDLGLVHVVRRGNRSYYRLDREATRAIIAELEQLLIPQQ